MNIFDTFLNGAVFIETLPLILSGLSTTILLGVTSIVCGFVIGLVLALARLYAPQPLALAGHRLYRLLPRHPAPRAADRRLLRAALRRAAAAGLRRGGHGDLDGGRRLQRRDLSAPASRRCRRASSRPRGRWACAPGW